LFFSAVCFSSFPITFIGKSVNHQNGFQHLSDQPERMFFTLRFNHFFWPSTKLRCPAIITDFR